MELERFLVNCHYWLQAIPKGRFIVIPNGDVFIAAANKRRSVPLIPSHRAIRRQQSI
jgi:hypothetical protein